MTKIKPAATCLVVRENKEKGIEVLLLKRNKALNFAPDYWVFPGGRVDPHDGSLDPHHMELTAKKAAAREAEEEAGIKVNTEDLYHYCHWTTPAGDTRRYATWFFHTCIPHSHTRIEIDRSEIVDHLWMHPYEALLRHMDGGLPLLPPTFISLQRIKSAQTYNDVRLEFDRTGVVRAEPVIFVDRGIFYSIYEGDAAYSTRDVGLTESKHRLIIDQRKRLYQFEYENCALPPVTGGVSFDL